MGFPDPAWDLKRPCSQVLGGQALGSFPSPFSSGAISAVFPGGVVFNSCKLGVGLWHSRGPEAPHFDGEGFFVQGAAGGRSVVPKEPA